MLPPLSEGLRHQLFEGILPQSSTFTTIHSVEEKEFQTNFQNLVFKIIHLLRYLSSKPDSDLQIGALLPKKIKEQR